MEGRRTEKEGRKSRRGNVARGTARCYTQSMHTKIVHELNKTLFGARLSHGSSENEIVDQAEISAGVRGRRRGRRYKHMHGSFALNLGCRRKLDALRDGAWRTQTRQAAKKISFLLSICTRDLWNHRSTALCCMKEGSRHV